MSLPIDALRAFVVLSEELHFGRAAARLHISQPALTKQIKRLENQINGKLFERTTGSVRLTVTGEALKDRCKIFVADAAAIESFARRVVEKGTGTLRIGFGIAVALDILPRAIHTFRRSNPNIVFEMQDLGSRQQTEMILEGKLDFGFVRMPIVDRRLESIPVLKEEIQLAVPANRFDKAPKLSDLINEPFVMIASSTSETFQRHAFALCAEAGFIPEVVLEGKEVFTVLSLVRAGLGASLVPSTARRMRVPGVMFYPLKMSSAKWEIALVWRKGRRTDAQEFTKAVLAARQGKRME
jgi:DNA-binding transcriptional LysR family regulator